jgi:hypothetical protein
MAMPSSCSSPRNLDPLGFRRNVTACASRGLISVIPCSFAFVAACNDTESPALLTRCLRAYSRGSSEANNAFLPRGDGRVECRDAKSARGIGVSANSDLAHRNTDYAGPVCDIGQFKADVGSPNLDHAQSR